eukprot:4470906-Amphidinium_carterae.1
MQGRQTTKQGHGASPCNAHHKRFPRLNKQFEVSCKNRSGSRSTMTAKKRSFDLPEVSIRSTKFKVTHPLVIYIQTASDLHLLLPSILQSFSIYFQTASLVI